MARTTIVARVVGTALTLGLQAFAADPQSPPPNAPTAPSVNTSESAPQTTEQTSSPTQPTAAASTDQAQTPAEANQPNAPRTALDAAATPEDKNIPIVWTRRGGFVLGLSLGFRYTTISAIPVEVEKRGTLGADVSAFTFTPGAIFLGGAITDWFAFEIGMAPNSVEKGNAKISGGDFLLRVETWPMFWKGGIWRDIGVGGEFGTGGASITKKGTSDKLADSGSLSTIAFNVFYDGLKFWRINSGPMIGFDYRTSATYDQYSVFIGFRSAFYGGP